MTEVSFNPSTKGPSQGHQAMGSAGSFWLPPKMRAETFNSNLQKFSTSSNKSKFLKKGIIIFLIQCKQRFSQS